MYAAENTLEEVWMRQAELTGLARNPVPSGAIAGTFRSSDSIEIRFARWETTAVQRRGTVCLFGGRAEFIEKYFETVTDLRRRGFAVASMDWRGQGGSGRVLRDPLKGHVQNFAKHDADVRQFMTEIVLPDCPPPFFCLAHSMGGHLVLRLAQTKLCWWERIVLCAPMIRFAGPERSASVNCAIAQAATLLGLGDRYAPGQRAALSPGQQSFADNPLTSDRLRFERAAEVLKAAPHLALGAPTIGWVAAACASISYINSMAFIANVRVPVLIVAAGNDRIVSTEATEAFAGRLKNCAYIAVSGSRHEILQERDELREQFWAAFDAYVPGSPH